ncbi:RNA polymerase factor sigma-54 [Evansella sp. AB-rgal1]|uniref:RNA polymerase factor sigma-54 n=1 Tax=Evansella sp. AB-rgal1 TaxID=3242696 RepID=UPI00359DDBE6
MNMDFGLYQQQSMKLVMTNELRQAITILQYSVLDLNQYLHEQQLENPLIELKEKHLDELEQSNFEKPTFSHEYTIRNTEHEESFSVLDQVSAEDEGLQDFLLNQIRFLDIDNTIRRIVTYIALSVDENGYLKQSSEEISEDMKEPIYIIEEAIKALQSLEPYGVGARSLQECLLIQLKKLGIRDLLAEKVVEFHLDELAKKQFKQIAKKVHVDIEEIQYISDFIQTLNPKPGSFFHNEPAKYIVPDVTVKKIKGNYIVELNDEYMPKMTMNSRYEALMKEGDSEVNQYMKQKYEQFQWIKKSIEQRQQTLLHVTKAIVEYQTDFLEHGPTHFLPLTLKQVADTIHVHESTVSRATTKKYVQTSRGVFELKYFFSSAVGKETGESNSSEKVKIYLRRLVDNEEKQKPLSDQRLSDLLKREFGIVISRRTVAKYREEMHIPASSQRKRY